MSRGAWRRDSSPQKPAKDGAARPARRADGVRSFPAPNAAIDELLGELSPRKADVLAIMHERDEDRCDWYTTSALVACTRFAALRDA